ncbi:MAG: trimethylamine methyltransferase family protein [Dethiobacteria bacterium]|nr:trimethylamine methyltransferase family protein [Dethiobacteria bacterium]
MHVNKTEYSALGMNIMTDDQAERIHNGTMQILERVGVKVFEPEALELLREGGARVDSDLVKIPSWLVQDALQSVPRVVSLYTRAGLKAMNLEKGRIHYGAGSEVPFTVDLDNGQRRKVLKTDVHNSARLIDALDNIDFAMSLGLISDVPVETSDVYQFEAMLLNTQKPILFTCYNRRNLDCIIEMASLAVGGKEKLKEKPNIALYAEPTSPLVHSREALEKALTCAAEGIPLIYATTPMLGATGPVTVAGSLVVANAEILSGLVIHQLKAKGAPFIYGGGIPPMHMGTSICSYGGPERDRGCIALVRMSQYYGLPSFTTAGCTDAHTFDQQAGMEAGFNIAIAGLAGGNLIHDLGYMGVGMISCLEYLLLCNEVVGAIKNLIRGIAVDEEHLALDLIEKVGPGGHYLAEEHTMKHFRDELYFPEVLNRKNYDAWSADGSIIYSEAANTRVKELLEGHRVDQLSAETVMKIHNAVSNLVESK